MIGLRYVLALAIAGATWMAFAAPDAKAFLQPRLARIIFFHLPCAFIATIFLFAGVFYSLKYLRRREWRFEIKAAAANEMGFLMAILTMVTGVLFSKVQWGEWWQWDPRQTSFLLVLGLFAGYFVLRSSLSDETKRARMSAAYSVAMALPAVFLIFVFPRLPFVQQISFHPSQTIASGGFDRSYSSVLWSVGLLLFVVTVWLFRLRVRVDQLDSSLEDRLGRMDDSSRSTDSRVVRPVPISQEN